MGANDVHGAGFHNDSAGCYKATVNESETITDAQPFCPVREPGRERANARAGGFRSRPPIERS